MDAAYDADDGEEEDEDAEEGDEEEDAEEGDEEEEKGEEEEEEVEGKPKVYKTPKKKDKGAPKVAGSIGKEAAPKKKATGGGRKR